MSEKRDTIIFDLGGVLVDWNPRHLYRKVFNGDEEKVDWFLQNVYTDEHNERSDVGVPFSTTAEELIAKFPDHEEAIRAYRDRWREMVSGPIAGTVRILSELKRKKTPLYALSNWSAETFPLAREMFKFLSWFDGIVISGEVRAKKPDPKIFHHLFERHRVEPDRSVFIDDVAANIEAARKLGLYGIHFQSPEKLLRELAKIEIEL